MNNEWSELDKRAVTMVKALAADAVENAGSGHPGAAISLAPAAYTLFKNHLRFDPKDPHWLGRDRFVLSAGHSSLTLYLQLYLQGMGLEIEDIKGFRHFGSLTPGHPEYGHTDGVEITTGPLGSGIASAVGMAMAARRDHGMLDETAAAGESIFDHDVYVIAGDGCMQEGISSEACSLAGVQELGNLVVLYDDNHISIEDDTAVAFKEDVLKRYESYGWHTQRVNWLDDAGNYEENTAALDAALAAAKAETRRPSIIALRTIIGWPSPTKQNTGGIHGAKLGGEELAGLKEALGLDPQTMFFVDTQALQYARDNAAERGAKLRKDWDQRFATWKQSNPTGAALLERIQKGELPAGFEEALPTFPAGKAVATRSASGQTINALAAILPELWGGSADLAGSNNTTISGADSFIPESAQTKAWTANPYGRVLHYGVREHAMGAIMNGIALDGLTRVFGGTFFVFADYMRGAVRLSSIMDLPVTYVWTHDSIGVGEDGPTHQPVEHLTAYRAIPNLAIVRPMDANETAQAWAAVLKQKSPAGLILTRQNLPVYGREDIAGEATEKLASAKGLEQGAYVLLDCAGKPDIILMGSGSEVQFAIEAAKELAAEGVQVRVVSVPCMDWFETQSAEYKESVLPAEVTKRVSIEAGLTDPWLKYVGPEGISLGISGFGLPGAAEELFEHFGLTKEAVLKAARGLLK